MDDHRASDAEDRPPLHAVADPEAPARAARSGPQRLRAAESPEAYAEAWLESVCAGVAGFVQAVVVLGPAGRGPFAPVAVWPRGAEGSPGISAAVEAAVARRSRVVQGHRFRDPARRRRLDAVALPLVVDDELCGAVGLEVEHRPEPELGALLDELEWSACWLEVLVRRRVLTPKDRLVRVLGLLATVLHHERFQAGATGVATELAGLLRCERVAIGFRRLGHVRLRALSHSATFGKKANLVRAIERAMDEAVDQQATVVYPAPEDGPIQVVRAHEALARDHAGGCACTVPFMEGERFLGAITLERAAGDPFDAETVELLSHAAAVLGPVLDVKRRDDRWLIAKAFDSALTHLSHLVGPRHVALKLATVAAVALVAFLVLAEGDYRVTADAALEGRIQRAVAAPMAGFVAEARVRAGDVVRAGEVMAVLDDRDLRLERLKLTSQGAQHRREYSEALAAHQRAKVRILGAQIEQVEAQLRLVDEQLARTRITAPFDGIVVAGDMSQSLGAPVERGDVLFEVAPLEGYRIILDVDERDVSRVRPGQTGRLALNGLPERALPMTVEKVTPVSTAEEGRNFFRVEARLEEATQALRPGMEGVGKIDIGRRKLAWIWSHKIIHWVRMFLWSWWP